MPITYYDIENGVGGFSQKNYQTKHHVHFSIEAAFSLSGALNIKTSEHHYTNIQSAIINSNVPHTFSCLNSECQLYFIDPTSTVGNKILEDYFNGGEDMVLINNVNAGDFREEHLLNLNKKDLYLKGRDERIQCCLNWLKENYSIERINISMLSKIVFLSESRLAHLFKEQVGISIHQYILWKKIEMAVKRMLEGFSLTDSAYSSGFADSSHFNKTFKKMFGMYPFFVVKK